MRLSPELISFFSNTKKMSTKLFPQIRKFDVTMRDVLESIPKKYTLDDKKLLLKKIMNVYKPHSLEIGSIISPHIKPQMKDSYELYNYANNLYNNKCDFYVLVPPTKHYLDIAKSLNIKNISLNTSITESFHKQCNNFTNSSNSTKHTQLLSIKQTKDIIKEYVNVPGNFDKVKLYVSCITHCPIKGKQDNAHIINEVYEYLHIDGISEVCLTDTCGNMRYSDFTHIIDYLNIEMNYKLEKLSLHLHINDSHNSDSNSNNNNIHNHIHNHENNYYTIDNIIKYAIINNVKKFDLSTFENIYFGNGIINVDVKQFNNNISYNRLYKSIYDNFIYK